MIRNVANYKHGQAFRGNLSPEYRTWGCMVQRCTNPNHESWKDYGGRGIKVCERWLHSFENFLADMGPKPSPQYSLDRYPDNNGNYEPGNVRWATEKEQKRNTRRNVNLTIEGVTKCATEWSEIYPQNTAASITKRKKRGWSDYDALFTPPQK